MSGLKRHTREEMPESMRETYDWVHRLTGQAAYVEAIASADRNDDDIDDVRRNVEHLELYVPLTDWGNKNLTPLTAAITLGNSILQS